MVEVTGGQEIGGRSCRPDTEREGGSLGRAGAGARARLSAGATGRQLAPGRATCALGAPGQGQCHLAPGNRRHFLGADPRPECGGGVEGCGAHGTGHEAGGVPVAPLPWLCPQPEGLGGGDGRFQGWGGHQRSLACDLRSWGIPSPLPACSPARVHPSLGSVPTLGPRAIARPP